MKGEEERKEYVGITQIYIYLYFFKFEGFLQLFELKLILPYSVRNSLFFLLKSHICNKTKIEKILAVHQ